MTTATIPRPPMVDEDREARPDWVVVARLMWGQDPLCQPTNSEIRAAVWLLLEQGYGQTEIIEHTDLERKVVARVHDLRKLATEPDRERGPNGGRRPQDARALAPSDELRNLVYGVRGRVLFDTALLVQRMVSGRRR